MALTRLDRVGDGSTTVYNVDFDLGILAREHVYVYRQGSVYTDQLAYVWVNDTQIELNTAIEVGGEFSIRRVVPRDAPVNDYAAGAILRESNLDTSFVQSLMILQEVEDGYLLVGNTGYRMESDIDMLGNRILNLPAPVSDTEPLRKGDAIADGVGASIEYVDDSIEQTTLQVIKHYTLAEATELTGAVIGQIVQITDRADGQFEYVSLSSVVANSFDIIQCSTPIETLALKLKLTDVANTKWFGAGSGLNDAGAINRALTRWPNVHTPAGEYDIDKDLNFKSNQTYTGAGHETKHRVTSSGINAFNLDNCLYATLKDFDVQVVSDNTTVIKIHSSDGGRSSSQLNKFYNVNVDGGLRAGTVSLLLDSTWSNQFHSCNFFRTAEGIVFGGSDAAENTCNANHFFGCELRSVNSVGHRAINHRVGDNNAFFGGIIENWGDACVMTSGGLLLDGVYLEAFAAGATFYQYGGNLKLDKCFRSPSVFIYGGESCSVTNSHLVNTPAYTETYPMVQFLADSSCALKIDEAAYSEDVYVVRAGQWRDAGVWKYRTHIRERISWMPSIFSIRLDSDKLGVTGDGEDYTIDFGNNKEFDYNNETDTNGVFTASQFGIWKLETNVTLSGLGDGDTVTAWIETSDRKYYIRREETISGTLVGGEYTIQGNARARLEAGATAVVKVRVVKATPATTVGVIRGNAVDAYTSFSGGIDRG